MLEKFEGIVLFIKPYREKDALVKIFTKEFGTKMFFIKNYHGSPNHKLKKYLRPISKNSYIGKINSVGFSFISEAESLANRATIQYQYDKYVYATYMSQLFDASIEDNVPNEKLYQFFDDILNRIEDGISVEILTVYVEIHLLHQYGIQLNWLDCQVCHQVHEPFDMSLVKGGLICHHHFLEDPYRLKIDPKAMHIAYLLANIKLSQMGDVKVSKSTMKELRRLMDEIYKEYVGINLKAKSFIYKMQAFEDSLEIQ